MSIQPKRYRRVTATSRVALLVAAALAAGLLGVRFASAAQPLRYVALGDSSAAGPKIPNQIDTTCGRSDHNWPHALAGMLGAELTDVTCSAATIPDLAGRQYGVLDPQFKPLNDNTDLVTLAIGGNDINLHEAFTACATFTAQPTGPTCQERYTVNGADQFAARIAATAPALATALEEIHRKSPKATVVVVGYLTYWRPGGCFPDPNAPADPNTPTDFYAPADADYLQATFDRLMKMLADQAAAHRAIYADIRTPSIGHDLCSLPADRWLEGATPASPALEYHPNANGMANAAKIIAATIPRG